MNTNLFYGTRTRTKYKPLEGFVEETEIIATRDILDVILIYKSVINECFNN